MKAGFICNMTTRALVGGWLLIGLCFAPVARAQDKPSPEALAAARELAAIMSPEIIDQMTAATMEPMFKIVQDKLGGQIKPEVLREVQGELQKITSKFTSEMMADMPAIYARHFSVSELREIVAFYRTPTGAKTLSVMPKLMGEITAIMMLRLAGLEGELQTLIERVMRQNGQNPK
jgi:uncharacterized protein